MEIQQMIEEINAKLEEENQKLKDQQVLVEELGKKYSEQAAILKVYRQNIRNLNSNLADLKRNQPLETDPKVSDYDENYEELTKLLDEAVDVGVKKGLIVETVMTKNGTSQSMRRSIINRARTAILRNCKIPSYTKWLSSTTDREIDSLRNVGKKTGDVIKIARAIINGQEVTKC